MWMNKRTWLGFISTLLALVTVHAADSIDQILLLDGFDARPDGALAANGGWTAVNPSSLNTRRKLEILADSGNLFGAGTANKVLNFWNVASSPTQYRNTMTADGLTTSSVVMVSFDFHEPSGHAGGVGIYLGSGSNAADPVNAFSLTDGSVTPAGSYTLDATHHIDAVFNESGAVLDYENPTGGVSSVGSALMDIWIDGSLVAAGVTHARAASPSALLSSLFITSDGDNQTIYFDNIEIKQADPVPALPPVITSFTADPAAAQAGGSITLSWNVAYADTLEIEPGVGDVSGLNSVAVGIFSNTAYSMIAGNESGSATSTVWVTLLPPDLAITNLSISSDTVVLGWNMETDHYIVISGADLDSFPASGTVEVSETSTPGSTATFSFPAGSGFFRIMSGIATNHISNPVLSSEVFAQASANAPINRIYDVDVDGITGMTLPGQEVAVSELGVFANLDKLSLEGSNLSSLGDLAPLSGLTWLNLSSNQLSDVSGLAVLTDLESLNLDQNMLSDLAGIESLVHLRWLDLENNQVSDLTAVMTNAVSGGLGKGDELWLRGNPLSALATNQIVELQTNFNVTVVY